MTTGLHILTEGDDADTLAGGSNNVISLFASSPPHDDFKLVGDEFWPIVSDLAVRMSGQFILPRLMVWAHAGEEGMSPDLLKEH